MFRFYLENYKTSKFIVFCFDHHLYYSCISDIQCNELSRFGSDIG